MWNLLRRGKDQRIYIMAGARHKDQGTEIRQGNKSTVEQGLTSGIYSVKAN